MIASLGLCTEGDCWRISRGAVIILNQDPAEPTQGICTPMATTGTRTTRSQARGSDQQDQLRTRILDAAAEAFTERGFDAATIDDVAKIISQTKGVVYYHFRSKVDLFFGVYERGMAEVTRAVEGALVDASGQSGADQLTAALVAHAAYIMRRTTYHVVIQEGVEHRSHLPLRPHERKRLKELEDLRSKYERLVQSLVRQGIDDHSIRDVSVRLATRTMLGAVIGIGIWYRPRGEETTAEQLALASEIVDIVVSGLKTR